MVRYCRPHPRYRPRRHRPARHLTMCDKSNALTYGHDLWLRVFEELRPAYPEVETATTSLPSTWWRVVLKAFRIRSQTMRAF